jgi:predicted dehydrogenase
MTSRIDVGLIGYGMAGRVFHAPLISAVDGLRLRSIVQRRGSEAEARYPEALIRRDADALFDDERIALVVVATPNSSHFDLARRALLAGKHVVVDKPFTVRGSEARELIALAREKRRLLTVFHNRRWEGDFLTIRRLLDANAFGRLVSYEARFDRFRNAPKPNAWRESSDPGSGILYDLGSHLVDQVLLLFGAPSRVSADVRRERDFGASDDAFEIRMEYPGMRATLLAGMLVREPTPRYTIRGTDATFLKFGKDPQEGDLAAGRSPRDPGWGREAPAQWGTLYSGRGEERIETLPGNYAAFYENVRDAIAGTAPVAVDPETAARTIEILERARE